MNKISFGLDSEKNPVSLYTLENDNLILKVSDLGATMVSLIDKSTGIDILLGHDNAEGYLSSGSHMGGFIGRTANRTRNAMFVLNGTEYHIPANQGKHNLHGGWGFDRRLYEVSGTDHSISFHRISRDQEEGYPGNLDVTVTYTLLEDEVEMKVTACSDQDTVFAFTNHNYYNLNGIGLVSDHEVKLNASEYADDDPDGLALLPLKPVAGTDFDFREFHPLAQAFASEDPQILANKGIDHHYAVPGTGIRIFAECRTDILDLKIYSDLPGMHMYTGNYLDGEIGKHQKVMKDHGAVCFEPEYFPDAINLPVSPKPILHAGETKSWVIRMELNRR